MKYERLTHIRCQHFDLSKKTKNGGQAWFQLPI